MSHSLRRHLGTIESRSATLRGRLTRWVVVVGSSAALLFAIGCSAPFETKRPVDTRALHAAPLIASQSSVADDTAVADTEATRVGDPPTDSSLSPGSDLPEEAPPRSRRDGDVPNGDDYLRWKLDIAKEQFNHGQYYSAFRLADAILVLEPQISFRREAMELRRRAQAYYLGSKVIVVTFVPDSSLGDEFPLTELRGILQIENVSGEAVTVGRIGEEGILGQVVFAVTDLFGDGGEAAATGRRTLRYDAGKILQPGESVDYPGGVGGPSGVGTCRGASGRNGRAPTIVIDYPRWARDRAANPMAEVSWGRARRCARGSRQRSLRAPAIGVDHG